MRLRPVHLALVATELGLGMEDALMSEPRWGVFARIREDGGDWQERHRWNGNDLILVDGPQAALDRADEIAARHPDWDVEARQTSDPLPGSFTGSFAVFLASEREIP